MGKITSISYQEKDKERCNIYIDGEFKCGLSVDLVYAYGLKSGEEISEQRLNEFILEDEKKKAFSKALKYVSKAMKTKWQVKDYLVKKGFSEQASWASVDKLKEYNYINDVDYAKSYIELNYKTQGKRLLESKLMAKGVKKEDILLAYEMLNISFDSSAKRVAEKYLKNKEITKENVLKACRYLMSRGFSYEESKSAVSSLGDFD